ncbi:unnamed protein product, partial [Ixodes pacificus]
RRRRIRNPARRASAGASKAPRLTRSSRPAPNQSKVLAPHRCRSVVRTNKGQPGPVSEGLLRYPTRPDDKLLAFPARAPARRHCPRPGGGTGVHAGPRKEQRGRRRRGPQDRVRRGVVGVRVAPDAAGSGRAVHLRSRPPSETATHVTQPTPKRCPRRRGRLRDPGL